MTGSPIEFYIEAVRSGQLTIEDSLIPKKLVPTIRDVLGMEAPEAKKPRPNQTTVTDTQHAAESSQKKALDIVQRRVSGTIARGSTAPPPPVRVGLAADSMESLIAFMETSQEDAQRVGRAFMDSAYAVRKDMVNIALEMVEQRRKRRGWAARFNYPDRGGKHYLEDALRKSAIVRKDVGTENGPGSINRGTGLEFVSWDVSRLEELTRTPRSNKGFILMYERGGTTIMPPGFWIGPTGPNTQGKTGKRIQQGASLKHGVATRASLTARFRGNAGVDRFYPGNGPKGVYMHEPAMNVLRDSLQAAINLMEPRIRKELAGSIALERALRDKMAGRSEASAVFEEDAYTANVDK